MTALVAFSKEFDLEGFGHLVSVFSKYLAENMDSGNSFSGRLKQHIKAQSTDDALGRERGAFFVGTLST